MQRGIPIAECLFICFQATELTHLDMAKLLFFYAQKGE